MANRNLADEVDALAKGLASLRAANKRTVSRVAALEATVRSVSADIEKWRLESLQAKERWDLSKYPPIKLSGKLFDPIPPSFWQRIRAWWAR